jgi:hypothetical protein
VKGLAETSSFAETETWVELYSKVDVRDVVEREVVVVDDDITVTCFGGATKRGEGWCLESGGGIVGVTELSWFLLLVLEIQKRKCKL